MASPPLIFPPPPAPPGQRGAALATTLILLVIVTLLALGATRFVAQEEKMATGILDRAIAFQSAEAGLREAERLALQSVPPTAQPNNTDGVCNQTSCSNGLCAPPDTDCTARWKDPDFKGWIPILGATDTTLPVEGFYEYLGTFPNWYLCDRENPMPPNCLSHRYRVTVRAVRTPGATVILERQYQGS